MEVWVINNMVWHVGGPGLSWGIEWESLLGVVFGFPGGMSISDFSGSGGFEVSIVFFDVEDVGFVCFESSSLSLSLGGVVNFHSGFKNLNHILGGLLGFGSGVEFILGSSSIHVSEDFFTKSIMLGN